MEVESRIELFEWNVNRCLDARTPLRAIRIWALDCQITMRNLLWSRVLQGNYDESNSKNDWSFESMKRQHQDTLDFLFKFIWKKFHISISNTTFTKVCKKMRTRAWTATGKESKTLYFYPNTQIYLCILIYETTKSPLLTQTMSIAYEYMVNASSIHFG